MAPLFGSFTGIEEVQGSPTLKVSKKKQTATQTLRVPTAILIPFLQYIFPPSYLQGPRLVIPPPIGFPSMPWILAEGISVEPFFGESDLMYQQPDIYPNNYAYWKVVIDYATPDYDYGTRDATGPGGNQNPQTVFSHKITIGGEFLTWPQGGLEWGEPRDPTILQCAPNLAYTPKQLAASNDVNAGIVVPTIEHHLTWQFVAYPPWDVIRRLVGKVNAYTFVGAPPETLLFMGAEASRDTTTAGTKTWTMGYKMSEKNNNSLNQANPYGWNHFLRPDGSAAGTFARIKRKIAAGSTTLMKDLGTGPGTMTVQNASGFPHCGKFLVRVGETEIMRVSTNQGSLIWAIDERGALAPLGSGVAAHSKGDPVVRVFLTQLPFAMDATQTILYLSSSSFPTDGSQFNIKIDNEIIGITSGGTFTQNGTTYQIYTLLRGLDGTTPAAHSALSTVSMVASGVYQGADFAELFVASFQAA